MRRVLALVVTLLATPWLMAAAPAPPASPVDYRLSPVMHAGRLTALAVEMRLKADASGATRLDLPEHYASQTELWRYVRDFHVEGARSVAEHGPAHRLVRSVPNAMLTVRYRVVSSLDHDPTDNDGEPFAPWVRPTWFYASGNAVFVTPAQDGDRPARFDWTGAPKGFAFASDLEHMAGLHRRAARPGTVNDIVDSTLLGGFDVKVFKVMDQGAAVRVALRGAYPFTGPQLLDQVRRVLDAERGFWRDPGSPYLVTVAPLITPPGAKSLSGSGRGDGFMLAITPSATLRDLLWTLAHENFHTWNGGQLGGAAEGPDEALSYWFTEGFTDFYANRLLWRAGLFDADQFAKSWSDDLLAYASSPVRAETNTRIRADFWNNRDVEKLPYQRGAFLAVTWDARLRAASNERFSLDDVVRYQRELASKATGRTTAPDLFVEAAAHFGLDVRADLKRYVDRGEPILLASDAFGPCFRLETVTQPRFDRGYDTDATDKAGNVVTGLRPDAPAYAAGLRDGMKLLGRVAGEPGNPDVEYALRVKDGATERVIRFMPLGEGTLTTQKLDKVDLAACKTPL